MSAYANIFNMPNPTSWTSSSQYAFNRAVALNIAGINANAITSTQANELPKLIDASQSPTIPTVNISALRGSSQFVGLTSTLALTVPLPLNADMTAMDSFIIYDASHNSQTYNITITLLEGTAKIYGVGLPTTGVTSLTINKNGGYVELLYVAANIWELKAGDYNLGYIAKTATYNPTTIFDRVINCTSGTFTVTLITAVGNAGLIQIIKNSGAGVITLDGNASETIDGALTQTINAGESITVYSNNANWIII